MGCFRFGAIAYTVFSWRTKHAVLIEAKTKQLKQRVAYLQPIFSYDCLKVYTLRGQM